MSNINDFLPFCPDDTGTNLIEQSDYAVASARTIGNQPGIASSKLNNKALRQGTYIASQFAQYVSNQAVVDVLDDDVPVKLLSQIQAALMALPPFISPITASSGTYILPYVFFIASGNATIGATYTNNTNTFTVQSTISGGVVLHAMGTGAPTGAGTLTKASGTGDATITFYAVRAPISLEIWAVGGGGGGGDTGSLGGNGGDTTFGTSLITAGGGNGGNVSGVGGLGGTPTVSAPAVAINAYQGNAGGSGINWSVTGAIAASGLTGGNSIMGSGGIGNGAGAGFGSGGGGSPQPGGGSGSDGGGGGGGANIYAIITAPSASYGFICGTGGTPATGGGGGAPGRIIVKANFQ